MEVKGVLPAAMGLFHRRHFSKKLQVKHSCPNDTQLISDSVTLNKNLIACQEHCPYPVTAKNNGCCEMAQLYLDYTFYCTSL